MQIHGGDIYRNKVLLDYSVNVNPLGIPEGVKKAIQESVQACCQYPDQSAFRLRQAISQMTGVDMGNIQCGNGASELFLAILHALRPRRTLLPVPCFGGYEYAARAAGSEIVPLMMRRQEQFCMTEAFWEEQLHDKVQAGDVLVLANPNNPVGNLLQPQLLVRMVKTCQEKGAIVIVDECFLELTGREQTHSMKAYMQTYQNLIIVRAFTKLFAIPGIRLGYLFGADEQLLARINGQLPEWNVSLLAQEAGIAACRESEYLHKSIQLIQKQRQFLEKELTGQGITVFRSAANYLLLHTTLPLYEQLLQRGILIRECSSYYGLSCDYYRIAVKLPAQNQLLLRQMKDVVQAAQRT